MEDALYEIESMRTFAGLRLSENLPDETTVLNFHHLLQRFLRKWVRLRQKVLRQFQLISRKISTTDYAPYI